MRQDFLWLVVSGQGGYQIFMEYFGIANLRNNREQYNKVLI